MFRAMLKYLCVVLVTPFDIHEVVFMLGDEKWILLLLLYKAISVRRSAFSVNPGNKRKQPNAWLNQRRSCHFCIVSMLMI